jgi:hypothetical protein
MSRFIKVVPGLLLLAIAIFWIAGRTLPDSFTIQSELAMDAPAPAVFARVRTAGEWRAWFVGPESEARVEGDGRLILEHEGVEHVLEITETSSPTQVRFRHYSDGSGLEPVEGRIDIEGSDGGSRVRIEERVSVPASAQRWLVWLFGEELMTQVLDRELHNLKGVVEGTARKVGGD